MIDERNEEASEEKHLAASIAGEVREHCVLLVPLRWSRSENGSMFSSSANLFYFSRRPYLHIGISIII